MSQLTASHHVRMPAIFLPHGGGPWPFIDMSVYGETAIWDRMAQYMRSLPAWLPVRPRSVLVISAHWEEAQPTIQSGGEPGMLYDYGEFPPEAYEVQWPSPGSPDLGKRIQGLLRAEGITSEEDRTRGFDHGVFVPLALAFPKADVPTLQLSLRRDLDPAAHVRIGHALQPLRDEGVLILGSGMSYHNLNAVTRGDPEVPRTSRAFDDWLAETVTSGGSEMETRLVNWTGAPSARACHPREEHLLPLMVVAGAAGADIASLPYRDVWFNARISAVHFGSESDPKQVKGGLLRVGWCTTPGPRKLRERE